MAEFCLVTRLTPADYRQLTLREYKAFLEVLERVKQPNGDISI